MSATIITVVQSLIAVLTSGLVGIASGLGEGIKALVTNLGFTVVDGAVTDASLLLYLVFIFAAVTIAIKLSIRIFTMITNIGK